MRTVALTILLMSAACSKGAPAPAAGTPAPAPTAADPGATPPEAGQTLDMPASTTPATDCAGASLEMDRNVVVAKIDGQPVRASDLGEDAVAAEEKALATYCREVQRIRTAAVDRAVDEKVLGTAAAKEQKEIGAFLRDYMETAVKDPSDEEIAKFYEENKAEGAPELDQVKDQVVRVMKDDKAKEVYGELLEKLRTEAKVELTLPDVRPPAQEIPIPEHTPTFGPEDAKVTIVEFSDFECPYCARAVPAIDEIKEKYGDKVRVAFRHFPLSFHKQARPAAEYAQCASEQDKFWEMHDAIFENQGQLAGETALADAAKKAGLDEEALSACLSSGRAGQAIDMDLGTGQKVGVEGTPSFFINGRPYDGAISGPAFAAAIEQELAALKG
jgi:protein-disulfide isomerase